VAFASLATASLNSTPDGQAQASSINLTSTDRIEVLRGPMALPYGNASGAVIQTFSRFPPEGPNLQGELYRGSFGMRKRSLQTGIRYQDTDLSLDYIDYEIDGYRRNSSASRQQIQSLYRYQFAEHSQLRLVGQRWDQP
jgi:iron complex outermembrane receptor protein